MPDESSKGNWLTPVPENVPTTKVTVSFKMAPEDVGKPESIKIEENMLISHISKNSFFNGLIMSDKVLRVNDVSGKASRCQAELIKGETCSVEVMRRKAAKPVTPERLHKSTQNVKPGHACFLLTVERPPHMNITGVGLKLGVIKKRAFVTQVDENTITYTFFGKGDSIFDIDGDAIPATDNPENWIREHLSKLSTGGRVVFLVERPIEASQARDYRRYIDSIAGDNKNKMADDVKNIGREASNMHFIVLKKLTTPSILSSDVRRTKKYNKSKTSEGGESSISISTASTEMKIFSDVDDPDDLKPVVTKSHAAGRSSDDGGCFDDE
uniref:PDZ domain-containing protein n=1 Tax=Caenorhabditis tropicalis TaxID=1561998 RepID=A0A1I7UM46_9PELO